MDATAWTVIGMGITILITVGAGFRSLRNGNERLDSKLGKLRDHIDSQTERLRNQIETQGKETTEQISQLRERMAKLEGLLEGLREAITGKRAA